jgi:hypothetical protein
MKVNANYLWLPGYMLAIMCVWAASSLLSPAVGVPIAALLTLTMLTVLSLVHQQIGDEIFIHMLLWGFVLGCACLFANLVIPADAGPVIFKQVTWLQGTFVVVQQSAYFGIHAFDFE